MNKLRSRTLLRAILAGLILLSIGFEEFSFRPSLFKLTDPATGAVYRALNIRQECRHVCYCRLVDSPDGQLDSIGCSQPHGGRMPSFGEHICPQQFRNLADWVYQWNQDGHGESLNIPYIDEVAHCLPEGAIIYAVGWHLDSFFANIYPQIKRPFVLITGESDYTVPFDHHLHYLTDNETKIIHWFAQNGRRFDDASSPLSSSSAAAARRRFTQIPIGLNCREHSEAVRQTLVDYRQADQTSASLLMSVSESALADDDPLKQAIPRIFHKWLLVNFDPMTDPTGEREELYRLACGDRWRNFTDCFPKEQGVKQYISRLPAIYRRNMRYQFWLSPRGNGQDCHRTWEALLLGRIPILRRQKSLEIEPLLADLPVLMLDEWEEVTEQLLANQFAVIARRRQWDRSFNFQKLQFSYWRRLILQKSSYYDGESLKGGASAEENAFAFERPARCWAPY